MHFNGKQLTAMMKFGFAMINADGKVEDNELELVAHEAASFGLDVCSCPVCSCPDCSCSPPDGGVVSEPGSEPRLTVKSTTPK